MNLEQCGWFAHNGPFQGSTPALFVGTTAFEVIVKQQIKRLEEPALKCCQLVYDELIRILGQLLGKIVSSHFLCGLCGERIYHPFTSSNLSGGTPRCERGSIASL